MIEGPSPESKAGDAGRPPPDPTEDRPRTSGTHHGLRRQLPRQGVIHLKSRALFGDVDHPDCRRFLECVFRAKEVSNVEIRDSVAELRYCPETHQLNDVVHRVASSLNGIPGAVDGQVKGTDGANGHLYPTNGYAGGHANLAGGATRDGHGHAPGVQARPIGKTRTATDRRGVVRYFRHDSVVSGWEVKQESPGRIKLKNPVALSQGPSSARRSNAS